MDETTLLAGDFNEIIKLYEKEVLLEIAKSLLNQPGYRTGLSNILYSIATTGAKYGALRAESWEQSYKSQFVEARKLMKKNEKLRKN